MRHIDIIRVTAIVPLSFLYEMAVNHGDPGICLAAAFITAIPVALAEAKHQLNNQRRHKNG